MRTLKASASRGERYQQAHPVSDRYRADEPQRQIEATRGPRAQIEVMQDAPDPEHRVNRHGEQEARLEHEDHRVRDVAQHLAVSPKAALLVHDEVLGTTGRR